MSLYNDPLFASASGHEYKELASLDCEVLIGGAGPTGLMLAHELALAGVHALIIDELTQRSGQSKATALQPRSAEILELRGMLAPLLEQAPPHASGLHFAGLPVQLDCSRWNTRYPQPLAHPQARLEAFLETRIHQHYGMAVRHGYQLQGFEQDNEEVTAMISSAEGDLSLRAHYFVGYDGAHSLVRKLLGGGFPGIEGTVFFTTADITIHGHQRRQSSRFPAKFEHGRMIVLAPHEGEVFRLIFSDLEGKSIEGTHRWPRTRYKRYCSLILGMRCI